MKKAAASSVVEDIWMDTMVSEDDPDSYDNTGAPDRWREIGRENIVLNPDPESMESRG